MAAMAPAGGSGSEIPILLEHLTGAPVEFHFFWICSSVVTATVLLVSLIHVARIAQIGALVKRDQRLVFLPVMASVYIKICIFFPLAAVLSWCGLFIIRFAVMFQLLLHLYEIGCLLWFWELMTDFMNGPEEARRVLTLSTALTAEAVDELAAATAKLLEEREAQGGAGGEEGGGDCGAGGAGGGGAIWLPCDSGRHRTGERDANAPGGRRGGDTSRSPGGFLGGGGRVAPAVCGGGACGIAAPCWSSRNLATPSSSTALPADSGVEEALPAATASASAPGKGGPASPRGGGGGEAFGGGGENAGGDGHAAGAGAAAGRCEPAANAGAGGGAGGGSGGGAGGCAFGCTVGCGGAGGRGSGGAACGGVAVCGPACGDAVCGPVCHHACGPACGGAECGPACGGAGCSRAERALAAAAWAEAALTVHLRSVVRASLARTPLAALAERPSPARDCTVRWLRYLQSVSLGPYRVLAAFPLCALPCLRSVRPFRESDLWLSYLATAQYGVFCVLAVLSRLLSPELALAFQLLSLASLAGAMYGLLVLFRATRRIVPAAEAQLGLKFAAIKLLVFVIKGAEIFLKFAGGAVLPPRAEPYTRAIMAQAWLFAAVNAASLPVALLARAAYDPRDLARRYNDYHECRAGMLVQLLRTLPRAKLPTVRTPSRRGVAAAGARASGVGEEEFAGDEGSPGEEGFAGEDGFAGEAGFTGGKGFATARAFQGGAKGGTFISEKRKTGLTGGAGFGGCASLGGCASCAGSANCAGSAGRAGSGGRAAVLIARIRACTPRHGGCAGGSGGRRAAFFSDSRCDSAALD